MPDWTTVWAIIAVAVIPVSDLGKLFVAFLAKRLGVKPGDITAYSQATDNGED